MFEQEPNRLQYPWYYDEDGPYLWFKTDKGTYQIRRYNTWIYAPTSPEHIELTHFFISVSESEDQYDGFHIFKKQFEDCGMDFDTFLAELRTQGFHTEFFDEPSIEDLNAYEKVYKQAYVPQNAMEMYIAKCVAKLDDEWVYYAGEDGWK
jgi:hypothetical protein